jgi:hypothetical protein
MTRMVVNAGHRLDHQRDSRQRPQVCVEAIGARPLPQRFLYLPELPGIELGFAASPADGVEGADAAAAPFRVPAAHTLAAHFQLAGDGGKNHPAGGKQAAGLFATQFELPKITAGTNRRGHASRVNDQAQNVTIFCETVTVLCEFQ